MKIAIVCYPTFGGSGVVATELGIALSKKGHEIHFITYKQPVRLDLLGSKIYFHEVNVPEYPLFHYQPYELALSSKLVDTVKLHGIEVLHVHYAIPHAYAAYMAKQMLASEGIKIPIVTTLHGTDITLVGSHPFYKSAVTFSINASDVVTSVSESLKKDTLRLFNITNEINVIPNFIDFNKYKEPNKVDCQRHLLANKEERIITHVSNFRKVKKIDDVIEIFYKIQKSVPSKLVMVGDGPELEPAEELVRKLNIEEKVIFLGKSNEVDKILCLSDLFLLPSETESFGLAALEAMASGVPVISSNTGGIPEVNIEGVSGYLAAVGDVDKMANKAIEIIGNEVVLNQFKSNAKQVAEKFELTTIVAKYEQLYLNALKH
jgi:L-malate glycosyltransferase